MSSPAISDVVTVVGSAYFQPIADLVQNLLRKPQGGPFPGGTGDRENGYSASLVILLVAVLESYTSRLRFVRNSELEAGGRGTPDLLAEYFPDLPMKDELIEVFLLRNVVAHNHIWHLDVSDYKASGSPTLSSPQELGFKTNKHYDPVVDVASRKTRKLGLPASPTHVDRRDVLKVFEVVWSTLVFMNRKDFGHTPLGGRTIGYDGEFRQFEDLIAELSANVKAQNAP